MGVNSGSLEKEILEKYGGVTAEGLVESALDKVHLIEEMGWDQLVISIKSSDVMMCVKAHELIAGRTDYPLHVASRRRERYMRETLNLRWAWGLFSMRGSGTRFVFPSPEIRWRR